MTTGESLVFSKAIYAADVWIRIDIRIRLVSGGVAFVFVIVCFTFSNGVVIKTGTYSVSILGMNAIDMFPKLRYEDAWSYFTALKIKKALERWCHLSIVTRTSCLSDCSVREKVWTTFSVVGWGEYVKIVKFSWPGICNSVQAVHLHSVLAFPKLFM